MKSRPFSHKLLKKMYFKLFENCLYIIVFQIASHGQRRKRCVKNRIVDRKWT
jgi:hypothetical protein